MYEHVEGRLVIQWIISQNGLGNEDISKMET